MNNNDYPVGADNKHAPWNEQDIPEHEIEVTVSLTMSKTMKISVTDYEVLDSGQDEDGNYFEEVDYSSCDLEGTVKNQHTLPIKGWHVDDFDVELE